MSVEITRGLIGYRLSTIPAGGGTTKPAVINNRSGEKTPSFPYASIDTIGLRKVDRHTIGRLMVVMTKTYNLFPQNFLADS